MYKVVFLQNVYIGQYFNLIMCFAVELLKKKQEMLF